MASGTGEIARRQFEIAACLGRGGFGEVYRAKMTSSGGLEADVAVKVLRNDVDPAGQALQRLRDEGRLLARLNHPAILRVHDLVLLDGCVSLVTEYVEGEDLAECLRDGEMPPRAVVEAVGAVASALDAAYNSPGPDGRPLHLVHRDIKPANIRISRHGQVKLLDFGIAKSRDTTLAREAKTATNMIVGSPGYMAPERFLDADVLPASDVFALGCVLFEGVTGAKYFADLPIPVQTGLAVSPDRYAQHRRKQLARLPQDVPEGVRDVIGRSLEYDPALRPTAAELAHRCDEVAEATAGASLARWARARAWPNQDPVEGPLNGRSLTEGLTLAARSASPAPDAAPGGRSGWGLYAVVAAALVVVLVGGGGFVALAGGGLVAMLYSAAPTADAPPVDAPLADAPVADAPVADAEPAVVDAEPAVVDAEPAVVDAEPVAEPAVPVEPRPVAAARPPPRPPAKPAGVAIGFQPKGDVTATLVGDGVSVDLPGEVPPGTYKIAARFNGSEPVVLAVPVVVSAGAALTVACDAGFGRCKTLTP